MIRKCGLFVYLCSSFINYSRMVEIKKMYFAKGDIDFENPENNQWEEVEVHKNSSVTLSADVYIKESQSSKLRVETIEDYVIKGKIIKAGTVLEIDFTCL